MGADFGGTGMELNKQIEYYSRDAQKAGVRAVIFGHALERRFHVNLLPETEEEKKKADELMEQWADAKAAEGVSLAAENGIGKVKAALVKERLSEGLMENMRAVKMCIRDRTSTREQPGRRNTGRPRRSTPQRRFLPVGRTSQRSMKMS